MTLVYVGVVRNIKNVVVNNLFSTLKINQIFDTIQFFIFLYDIENLP